jgi:hypothetical protein
MVDIMLSSRSFSLNSTVMLVRQCGFDDSWRDVSDLKFDAVADGLIESQDI